MNPKRSTYTGLFLITLATLMLEILMTRIFSVTMWYHFAFLAISTALFGATLGAIIVYLRPGWFSGEVVHQRMAAGSLLFAVTVVFSFLVHLAVPFNTDFSLRGVLSMALTYVVISLPYVFSGVVVTLALTRFPGHVGRLYAADLIGAALGCVVLLWTMSYSDGPSAVIFVAALAAAGGTSFACAVRSPWLRRWAVTICVALLVFTVLNTVAARKQTPLLHLTYTKTGNDRQPLTVRWNSFSRVAVHGNPQILKRPVGWGLSDTFNPTRGIRRLTMLIDAHAATNMIHYTGNPNEAEYLKYDIINLAHYLRQDASVLVVGAGGGRDVLSALVFGQHRVEAVEINDDIIDLVTGEYAPFVGNLHQDPRVAFTNDEARSYVARQQSAYDVIQVSFIDTWAATSSGAYVLTEQSLYTVEAWAEFFESLKPRGILTVSRLYFRDEPATMYRLVGLAAAALRDRGVTDPRQQILLVRHLRKNPTGDSPEGVGTILVSRDPFSEADLDTLESVADRLDFSVILSPRFALDGMYSAVAAGEDLESISREYTFNILPPTDDSPFFFHLLRLRDAFGTDMDSQGMVRYNLRAVFVLAVLLIVVGVLTLLCILVPLLLTRKKGTLDGALPFFLFFAAIGFGFIIVEISQLQRLMIFLGHPSYSLSVVLFSLLVSGGIGSWTTRGVTTQRLRAAISLRLGTLLGILILFGVFTPSLLHAGSGLATPVRILVAITLIAPLGLFMGMAFPLGMKAASGRAAALTPWLWGINGATSVCGSVLAVVVALSFGITASFWSGFACYVLALAALRAATRV